MITTHLKLLSECNFRCKYCYQERDDKYMDLDTAIKAIDLSIIKAKELNKDAITIAFYGGEPLIKFPMIRKLVEYTEVSAVKEGLKSNFEITTNGSLFSQEVSEFFSLHRTTVKISLDGRESDHNLNRVDINGKGTYEAIMANKNAFNYYQQKTKRPIQISMVINKNTYKNFFENLKYIVSLGFSYIDMALNFDEVWETEDMNCFHDQVKLASEFYLSCIEREKPFNWTFVDYGLMPQLKKRKNYFCGAGVISSFVTENGDIYPCSSCTKEQVRLGNLNKEMDKLKLKSLLNYKRCLSEECDKCDIKEFCAVCDCIFGNFNVNDNFNQVSYVDCRLSKIRHVETKKMMDNLELRRVLSNRGFI